MLLFKMTPSQSTMSGRIVTLIVALNFGQGTTAMATNFVARDGDNLAYPAFVVCAGILQQMGISQWGLLQPQKLPFPVGI